MFSRTISRLKDYDYNAKAIPSTKRYAKRFFQKEIKDNNNNILYYINCYNYINKFDMDNDRFEFEMSFKNDFYSFYATMYYFNNEENIDLQMIEEDALKIYKIVKGDD